MEQESHPWMMFFTITALVSGIIAFFVVASSLGSGSDGQIVLAMIGLALVIGGAIWVLVTSNGFKHWSILPGWKKFLGVLVMIIGCYAGIAIIVVFAAIKASFDRRD